MSKQISLKSTPFKIFRAFDRLAPNDGGSPENPFEVLNDAAQVLVEAADFHTTLAALSSHAVRLTNAETCGYILKDPLDKSGVRKTLFWVAEDHAASVEALTVVHPSPLVALTCDDGQIVHSDDIRVDPRYQGMGTVPIDTRTIRSYLAVPVWNRDCIVHGSLIVGHSQFRRFSTDHVSMLKVIASFATAALDRTEHLIKLDREARERKMAADALIVSERRFAKATRAAGIGITEIDAQGRFKSANQTYEDIVGVPTSDLVGCPFWETFEPEDRDAAEAIFQRLVSGEIDSYTRQRSGSAPDGRRFSTASTVVGVRNDRNEFVCAVRVTRDVTEDMNAKEQEQLLLAELTHRVKNTLATIQSLAAQTIRTAPSLEAFEESFRQRLQAISVTHALLIKTNWAGASLAEVLHGELEPYFTADTGRWSTSGPNVLLNASSAVNMGLVLHELTTNAVKYGALSGEAGRLSVTWEIVRENAEDRLRITWAETGGPTVTRPSRKGFGTRLLTVIARDFSGSVNFDYAPEGVRAVLDVSTATILASGVSGPMMLKQSPT